MRKKGLRTHRTLARDDNALIDAMHILPRPLNQVAQCPLQVVHRSCYIVRWLPLQLAVATPAHAAEWLRLMHPRCALPLPAGVGVDGIRKLALRWLLIFVGLAKLAPSLC